MVEGQVNETVPADKKIRFGKRVPQEIERPEFDAISAEAIPIPVDQLTDQISAQIPSPGRKGVRHPMEISAGNVQNGIDVIQFENLRKPLHQPRRLQ